jgi:hypothetical protein
MTIPTILLLSQVAFAGDGVKVRPHVKPIISGQSFLVDGDRYTGLNVGGAVGVRYRQKNSGLKLTGLTRVQYVKTLSLTDTTGEDLRIGTSIGPWWRIVGVQVGVDGVRNSYSNAVVTMPQAYGVAPTISALVDLRIASLSAVAGPTYYFGEQRQAVDWNTTAYDFPGFGDEFYYKIRAGFDLLLLNVGVTYSNRYTAYGVEQMVGFGIGLF